MFVTHVDSFESVGLSNYVSFYARLQDEVTAGHMECCLKSIEAQLDKAEPINFDPTIDPEKVFVARVGSFGWERVRVVGPMDYDYRSESLEVGVVFMDTGRPDIIPLNSLRALNDIAGHEAEFVRNWPALVTKLVLADVVAPRSDSSRWSRWNKQSLDHIKAQLEGNEFNFIPVGSCMIDRDTGGYENCLGVRLYTDAENPMHLVTALIETGYAEPSYTYVALKTYPIEPASQTYSSVEDDLSDCLDEDCESLDGIRATGHTYEIGDLIAKGGCGLVYAATDVDTGEAVAIKTTLISEDQKGAAEREIRFMKMFEHPHIIQLKDVFENDGNLCMVMEKFDDGDFWDVMVKNGKFSEKEAIPLLADLASALECIHAIGVVHRDIKPNNILVKQFGDDMLLLTIADLGLAVDIRLGEHVNDWAGTPEYMAPEMEKTQHYDTGVDVWSLGVVLFDMLFGVGTRRYFMKPLFKLLTESECSFQELQMVAKGQVSARALHLLAGMLASDPRKRFTATTVLKHPWLNGFY